MPRHVTQEDQASGIGYSSGQGLGGSVTQATSKATAVALHTMTGRIITAGSALAANTTVAFTLNNTKILPTDIILVAHTAGGAGGAYSVTAFPSVGSAIIYLRNVTAGSLSQVITISFSIIKSSIT